MQDTRIGPTYEERIVDNYEISRNTYEKARNLKEEINL